jgi:hypothetical protein
MEPTTVGVGLALDLLVGGFLGRHAASPVSNRHPPRRRMISAYRIRAAYRCISKARADSQITRFRAHCWSASK